MMLMEIKKEASDGASDQLQSWTASSSLNVKSNNKLAVSFPKIWKKKTTNELTTKQITMARNQSRFTS